LPFCRTTVQLTLFAAPSFIFPILPIAHVYAGHFLAWAYERCVPSKEVPIDAHKEAPRTSVDIHNAAGVAHDRTPQRRPRKKPESRKQGVQIAHAHVWKRKQLLFAIGCAVLLLTHVGMAYYFSFWHQRSPIDVMHHLRQEAQRPDSGTSSSRLCAVLLAVLLLIIAHYAVRLRTLHQSWTCFS
jgi:hypothetical protein